MAPSKMLPALWNQLSNGEQPQSVEGEILIIQSIQLGFSLSLGSATSNEANKSAMLRSE